MQKLEFGLKDKERRRVAAKQITQEMKSKNENGREPQILPQISVPHVSLKTLKFRLWNKIIHLPVILSAVPLPAPDICRNVSPQQLFWSDRSLTSCSETPSANSEAGLLSTWQVQASTLQPEGTMTPRGGGAGRRGGNPTLDSRKQTGSVPPAFSQSSDSTGCESRQLRPLKAQKPEVRSPEVGFTHQFSVSEHVDRCLSRRPRYGHTSPQISWKDLSGEMWTAGTSVQQQTCSVFVYTHEVNQSFRSEFKSLVLGSLKREVNLY